MSNPLRQYREAAGLTQLELGQRLGGIQPNQIGEWERAQRLSCRLETAFRLADVLGVTVQDLFPEPQPAPQEGQ